MSGSHNPAVLNGSHSSAVMNGSHNPAVLNGSHSPAVLNGSHNPVNSCSHQPVPVAKSPQPDTTGHQMLINGLQPQAKIPGLSQPTNTPPPSHQPEAPLSQSPSSKTTFQPMSAVLHQP